MALIRLNSRSIPDATITADDISEGAIEGALSQPTGRKNLIINGAMQVAQRGTSASTFGYGSVDRFTINKDSTDELAITQSQESDAPSGFSKSLQVEVTTAESTLGADEFLRIYQAIEGQNLQQLAYGTSSAKELTLSFWVKSSVTGTYAVMLYIFDANRNVGATYTVNSADTWEYKTITLPADTSGSLPNDDNTAGAFLNWALSLGTNLTAVDNTSWGTYSSSRFGYGQTADVASTLNATWQITGVQLEVGDTATPFEHRSYGEELALCQRYYYRINGSGGWHFGVGMNASGTVNRTITPFPVPMRTIPSALEQSGTASDYRMRTPGGSTTCNAVPTLYTITNINATTNFTVPSVLSANGCAFGAANTADGFLAWSAEL